jgi:Family of unknown function (DUF6529)
MTTVLTPPAPSQTRSGSWGLAWAGLVALLVGGGLAAYAIYHPPTRTTLFGVDIPTMLLIKSWLTSGAAALAVIQVVSALAMWGKLPGVKSANWASPLHRWSGTTAFLLTIPVGFHCVWALGFSTFDARTIIHSTLGCVFYGIFGAKMLSLRMHRLPGWTLPLLGGLLAATLAGLWFGAALWYFGQNLGVTY